MTWKFDYNLQLADNEVLSAIKGEVTQANPPDRHATEENIKVYNNALKVYSEMDSLAGYLVDSSIKNEPKQHILTFKSSKEMSNIFLSGVLF